MTGWNHDYNRPNVQPQLLANTAIIAMTMIVFRGYVSSDVLIVSAVAFAARLCVLTASMIVWRVSAKPAGEHLLRAVPVFWYDLARYSGLVWYAESSKNMTTTGLRLVTFVLLWANNFLIPTQYCVVSLLFKAGAPSLLAMNWFAESCTFIFNQCLYLHVCLSVLSLAFNLFHLKTMAVFFKQTIWKRKCDALCFSVVETVVLGASSNVLRCAFMIIANNMLLKPDALGTSEVSSYLTMLTFVNLAANTLTLMWGELYTVYDRLHTEWHGDPLRYHLYHAQHHFTLPVMGMSNAGDVEVIHAELLLPYNFTLLRPISGVLVQFYHYVEHIYYPTPISRWVFNMKYMHLEHHFGRLQPLQLFPQSDWNRPGNNGYDRAKNDGLWKQLHHAAEIATNSKDYNPR